MSAISADILIIGRTPCLLVSLVLASFFYFTHYLFLSKKHYDKKISTKKKGTHKLKGNLDGWGSNLQNLEVPIFFFEPWSWVVLCKLFCCITVYKFLFRSNILMCIHYTMLILYFEDIDRTKDLEKLYTSFKIKD